MPTLTVYDDNYLLDEQDDTTEADIQSALGTSHPDTLILE
jgi:hypothetical protein